ncbi:MAG: copper ion binding protein, partial [Chitinispirillaceae bacterium]
MSEHKKATFAISGMHCASCAINIEKSLQQKSGVDSARVNFGAQRATVEFDPETVGTEELERTIESLGFGIVRNKTVVRIGGMHCASCAQTIEKNVGKLPGVNSAEVNFGAGTAAVVYDPASVTLDDIRKAVQSAGFEYLGVKG